MPRDDDAMSERGGGAPARRRWVSVIPIASERRLYFVATLVLVVWYLLDRLLAR